MDSPMPVSMEDTEPMALTPTPMATTARGLLRPSPRLRLTPLFCMDPTDTPDTPMPVSMVLDTGPMEPTPILMPTTARGPLRPSLRLRLTPLFCMAPMAMDSPIPVSMEDTEPMELTPTPMDTTARGLLRPSPRLRLTPLFCMAPMDMAPTPMPVSMVDTE